ncbi:MAG: AAA family ATPase [Oscillospiraceae bacterium]|nr:AAA family ATPase [Oscillospiraceae bacterium]
MEQFKPIPIGHEDFKTIIENGCYYVDKTLMIRDLIRHQSKVSLFTRPRRFGKTLNMSMIQRFFEKTEENNSHLFEGLKIAECPEYMDYQGQYPVISLSLKSMKQPSYKFAFEEFKKNIRKEFWRHRDVMASDALSPVERNQFKSVCDDTAEDFVYITSIKLLSDCLSSVSGKNVIILIDEYDVPLENAYFRGFYDEMVDLIRSAFESALKTNNSLEFGVLTGCLRISKESIFTGLNNLVVYSITENLFSQYFGFTKDEIKEAAVFYGISDRLDEIQQWYDGYCFGETEIYNPWSMINYIQSAISRNQIIPSPYWSNTSSNDIIRDLIIKGDKSTHNIIEKLINGCSVTATVYEDITYRNIDVNSDYIWSFLLFTGYLKQIRMFLEDDILCAEMVIPNKEVRSIYRNTITQWFNEKIKSAGTGDLFTAVVHGDTATFENEVNRWLRSCISYHDNYENFYHGFLAGLLIGSDEYIVRSNRESGTGRSDIIICEYQRRSVAVIIEIKVAEKFKDLDRKCDEALHQIEDRQYEAELIDECYQNIVKYGVAFCGEKVCRVKKG